MKSWKLAEARIAELFGHVRRPGSGAYAAFGASDTMDKTGTNADIFIEIKHRKSIPFLKTIRQTIDRAEAEAKKENRPRGSKPWAVIVHEKNDRASYAIVDAVFLATLYRLVKGKEERP